MAGNEQYEHFKKWALDVETNARQLCNDSENKRLTFKVDLINGDIDLDLHADDVDALNAIEKSVQKYDNDDLMPMVRMMYLPVIRKMIQGYREALFGK